jgi:hypothetical protein
MAWRKGEEEEEWVRTREETSQTGTRNIYNNIRVTCGKRILKWESQKKK